MALDCYAGSQPVLVTNTDPIPVTGSFTPSGTQDVRITAQTITLAVSAASLPLPSGAATDATLSAVKTDLDKFTFSATRLLVDGSGVVQPISGTVAVSNFPAIQPVSQSGSWTVSLATESIEIGTVDQGTPNAGGASAWPVAVSNFPGTQPVSGTITANQGTSPWVVSGTITTSPNVNVHDGSGNTIASTGTSLNVDVTNTVPVTGTFFQATQPVSVASLPLPSGASTEATLALIKAKTDNLDVALSTRTKPADTQIVSGTVAISGSVAVTGPLTDTQLRASAVPISAASLPLPTGAATSALQTQPGVDIGDVTVNNASGASAVNIQDGGNSITVDGTVSTNQITSGTSTLSNISASASSVTVLAANANRKMAMFFNDSTSTLSLKFGATASATSFTVQLIANAYYELPTPVYTGILDGIWTVATGTVRVTELT